MKKKLGPIVIVVSVVIVLGIIGFVMYQAFNATVPTVHVTTPPTEHPRSEIMNGKPVIINGKPVPAGAPYQEYLRHRQKNTSP